MYRFIRVERFHLLNYCFLHTYWFNFSQLQVPEPLIGDASIIGDYLVMPSETISAISQSKEGSHTQEVEAKLLDGQFCSQEAKTHVLGILGKSIQHHWVQSFKHHEDSMECDEYSDVKMAELSKLRDDFQLLLDKAESDGLILDIKASLKVSFVSNNQKEKMVS